MGTERDINSSLPQATEATWADRALRVFGDVRAGEGTTILLMFLNIHFLLGAFYILKTVREPLILAGGGAELKSYAAAFQALALIAYVPLYGWVASRLPRQKLILVVILFFVVCIQLFAAANAMDFPFTGFVFFVWLGIFSVSMVAQFWSYANDIYSEAEGKRVFAIIAVGATSGAPLGAALAGWMYSTGISSSTMMQIASAVLLIHLALYGVINRRVASSKRSAKENKPLERDGGFALVFRSRYLLLIGVLYLVLNIVNKTGEYILSRSLLEYATELATQDESFDIEAFIGNFYGSFFFAVNVTAFIVQAFLVSRIVKYMGMAGALLILPLVGLGAYSLVVMGAGFAIYRIAKLAENAADYSIMNTAREMLWLPTKREEKYKAKQAIDTFFVRAGDVISAGVVFVASYWLALDIVGFAWTNIFFTMIWLGLVVWLLREYKIVSATAGETAGGKAG